MNNDDRNMNTKSIGQGIFEIKMGLNQNINPPPSILGFLEIGE
jgi:hypothetical protein